MAQEKVTFKLTSLSVFFPAYNEEAHLQKTVEAAIPVLKLIASKYEILIINDGSKDKTGIIAAQLAKKYPFIRVITHPINRGYGGAFKSGLYGAKYEWIAFTDADGQFDFAEITKFIEKQKETGADLVIGSYIKRAVPLVRIFGSKVWEGLVFLLFGLKVTDIDCGFKFFRRSVAKKINDLEAKRGPFINSEFLIKAKKAGFKIVEVPVHHYPRTAGKATGTSLKVIISGFSDLFRLWRKGELVLLFLILAAGAFLRLYNIAGYMTFLGDEGRDVLVVRRMIVDHKFTLLGPTASVGGFFFGPLYYYLMLPFLWLFRLNPVGPAVMVALFGVVTIWLVYRFGKDFFNSRVGLLAASLYAISPVIIASSRSSWNPNLVPFFSLSAIYTLRRSAEVEKTRNYLLFLGFLFGLLLQLHYLTIFLIIASLVYSQFFCHWGKRWLNYVLVFLGLVVGWSPFLLFEVRHGFPNFISLYRFIFYGKETGLVENGWFNRVSDLVYRLYGRLITNNQSESAFCLLFLSLVFFVYSWYKARQKVSGLRSYGLLASWLTIGVFLFVFYRKPVYDHYLGFLFPLPFLLVALMFDRIAFWNKLGKLVFWLIWLLLLVINLKGAPFRFQPNRQLAQTQEIAKFIIDRVNNQPYNFALITGGNSDHAYRYFLELSGNSPVTILNPQVDPERNSVTDQLWVICETLPCSPEGHSLWEIAGFGRAKIIGEWSVSVVKIYRLEHWRGDD